MHEIKQKAKQICELKDKILEWTKTKLEEDCIDIEAAGQTIDMVKDLCDAEKNIYKAAYYCSIVEAMKEEEEMEEMELKMGANMGSDRMGYDHWRTSSGRYANKGTGHWTPIHGGRRGYTPTYPPYYPNPMMVDGEWPPEMMGYDGRGGGDRSRDGSRSGTGADRAEHGGGRYGYSDPDMERYFNDDRHGRSFKNWQLARKHYTETKSEGDRQEMTEHAKEHMVDTCMTLKDIWQDATPELRERMKKDLTALMAEMK